MAQILISATNELWFVYQKETLFQYHPLELLLVELNAFFKCSKKSASKSAILLTLWSKSNGTLCAYANSMDSRRCRRRRKKKLQNHASFAYLG